MENNLKFGYEKYNADIIANTEKSASVFTLRFWTRIKSNRLISVSEQTSFLKKSPSTTIGF